MPSLQGRLKGGGAHPMLVRWLRWAVLSVFLSSCGANRGVHRDILTADQGALPAPYSIVYVIHGDGDYLYHDTGGNAHRADEEALTAARRVAERNPRAEVFIFHQRPREHALFLFPLRDGDFCYYRNRQLVAYESYWRDQDQSRLGPEVELYHRFRADERKKATTIFLYYGHEIPECGGAGYDASYPDRPFTVDDFAAGLGGFARDSGKFDILVLSTCFGGTPYTIDVFGMSARYIIASPENLHLSYFDSSLLEQLDVGLQDGDVRAFARRFARRAFDHLSEDVQTAVSVAVYDVDRVRVYLDSIRASYGQALAALQGETRMSLSAIGRCDCANIPAYVRPAMKEGVETFYRPARFGRLKDKQGHSGWECWREKGVQE
jgi:hypothetical protein